MSFIGAVGVVAQQGNQSAGAGPTGVSIATTAAGNYANAFSMMDMSDLGNEVVGDCMSFSPATSSESNKIDHTVYGLDHGAQGGTQIRVYAYLRAVGAATYQMTGSISNSSMSNGCIVAFTHLSGSSFDAQDGTGVNGIGDIAITHGGGRGGILLPADGDNFDMLIEGTATAAGGSTTDATDVESEVTWKA